MTTAQALESVLNAWVNGRKVRDGIPLTIRQQAEQALLTADAQATVEALQAQLREGEAAYHNVGEYNDHLKQQVEALQREHLQLQALVRSLPVVEGPVKDEDILDNWESDRITFEALRGLLEYRATLDATTPAECTNHFTDGSKIFPSRNCCSKGGDGE